MQANRLGDAAAKELVEDSRARLLMQVVDALLGKVGIFANQQMSEVVEQAGNDQVVAEMALCSKRRGLQGVFQLTYCGEAIAPRATVGHEVEDVINRHVHGSVLDDSPLVPHQARYRVATCSSPEHFSTQ